MPKVVLGAAMESVRGKLGGSFFRKNRSGIVLGHTVKPAQRQTAAEARIRGNINQIAGDWTGLTDLQRDAWNRYASLTRGPLTGFNMFIRHNTRLLNANHASLTPRTMPPATPSTPDLVRGLDANNVNGSYTITWTTPNANWQWVQVQYSIQVGFSMKGKERWTLLPAVLSSALTTSHALSLPTGYQVDYRARSIDNHGRVSPWNAGEIAGAAPPPEPPGDWLWLREHRAENVAYSTTFEVSYYYGNPDIKATTNNWVGDTLMFFAVEKAWLDGKKIKCRVKQTSTNINLRCKVVLFDGKYEGDNDTHFPDKAPFVTFGAGLLYTALDDAGPTGWTIVEWTPDLSAAEEDYVTIMFWGDSNANTGAYWWLDYMQILSAGDELLVDFTVDSLTMVRTGTFNDYGYTGSGP